MTESGESRGSPAHGAFRSVVVATDLSEGSDVLVRAAADVAARSGGALHVVHAVDLTSAAPEGAGGTFEERVAHAERAVDEQIRGAVHPRAIVNRHVATSEPDRAILERAQAVGADLIVVGPHVRRAGRLLGSTAERVLGEAGVPCLVVRIPVVIPAHHVVAAVDPRHLMDPVLENAIRWALLFGDPSVPRVSALYVTGDRHAEPPAELDAALRSALSRLQAAGRVDAGTAVRGTDVVESIVLYAEVEASDLLVLSTHNRGVLGRALLGSISAEVTRRAPSNVLLVPPQG
jgi:universal stress protein A